MQTDKAKTINLLHKKGYPFVLDVSFCSPPQEEDTYELAAADLDGLEAFRVEGTATTEKAVFPAVDSTPTGVYRYAVIRTRNELPEQIIQGVLTVIPHVQPHAV